MITAVWNFPVWAADLPTLTTTREFSFALLFLGAPCCQAPRDDTIVKGWLKVETLIGLLQKGNLHSGPSFNGKKCLAYNHHYVKLSRTEHRVIPLAKDITLGYLQALTLHLSFGGGIFLSSFFYILVIILQATDFSTFRSPKSNFRCAGPQTCSKVQWTSLLISIFFILSLSLNEALMIIRL